MTNEYIKKIAVFPGSFDPITNGHVDIVTRTLEIFEVVHIAVMDNATKTKALFSVKERVDLIKTTFSEFGSRVIVGTFSGLLVDYLKINNAFIIVRGLRATSDFDYEAQLALMNQKLMPGVDTLFMMAREENSYISSSLVKQVAPLGGNIEKLVPSAVVEAFKSKIK